MASLEEMIRKAAENGELTHLSICPVAGKGPYGCDWSASYSPASTWGAGFGRSGDPVEAIKIAMADKRLGKVTNEIRKTLDTAAAAGNKKARKAAKKLPPVVDDSDFL